MATYHIRQRGREIGVMSGNQLKNRLIEGEFDLDTEVRKQGEELWHRMGDVASLRDVIRARQSNSNSSFHPSPPPVVIHVDHSKEIPTTNNGGDELILTRAPAMFRNHPIRFLFCIATIPLLGLGAIWLFLWWLECYGTRLELTKRLVRLRRGILAKRTTEIRYVDVRNLQCDQSMFQRMFGVGTIKISSAGQGDIEIVVSGIAKPQEIVTMIRKGQHQG